MRRPRHARGSTLDRLPMGPIRWCCPLWMDLFRRRLYKAMRMDYSGPYR